MTMSLFNYYRGSRLDFIISEITNNPRTFGMAAAAAGAGGILYSLPRITPASEIAITIFAGLGAIFAGLGTLRALNRSRNDLLNHEFQQIRDHGMTLESLTQASRSNFYTVLEAVRQNGLALQFASEALRNDPYVVLAAVNQNGLALQFASAELRNDRTIVPAAIRQNGFALQYASAGQRNSRIIAEAAVRQNGLALQYASAAQRDNFEIVAVAMRENPSALQFASQDRVLVYVEQHNGLALQFASEALRSNENIVLAAVRQNGLALQFASEALKSNENIVLAAVRRNGLALQFASEALKSNENIVLAAVRQNGSALRLASDAMQHNADIVGVAARQIADAAVRQAERDRLEENIEIAHMRDDGLALQFTRPALRSNENIVLAAVRQNGLALQFASDAVRDNADIVGAAVHQNGLALQYASAALRNRQTIAEAAVNQNILAFQYVGDALRNPAPLFAQEGIPLPVGGPLDLTSDQILHSAGSLQMSLNQRQLFVHPLILEKQPERVLKLLASRDSNSHMPQIVFLKDNLTPQNGVDMGGLRNQLMSDLFRNLLDGHNQTIHMDASIPVYSSLQPPEEERASLTRLGIMLGRCFQHGELSTGRVLPDEYFKLLLDPILLSAHLSDEQICSLGCHIASEIQQKLYKISQSSPISAEDRAWLQDGGFEINPMMNADAIKQTLIHDLATQFLPKIDAAREIARGINSTGAMAPMRVQGPVIVSQKIQGIPFNRKTIHDCIVTHVGPGVVREKVQWLKEHILDPATPQAWIEQFIYTVTGQRSVMAQTLITIHSSSGTMCQAHTCSKALDIPDTHQPLVGSISQLSNKERFFKNLQWLMDAGPNFEIA